MLNDTVIVTPTRRLSRYLRHRHAMEQLQQGNQAWETPQCLPWNAWCEKLYERLALVLKYKQHLLSATQQAWLWQDIINRSSYSDRLLQINATAQQAMQTYRMCQQWAIPIFPEGIFLSEDAMAFKNWANSYEQIKHDNNWLDESTLPAFLCRHVSQLQCEARIVLRGFELFTYRQQELIDAIRGQGIDIVQVTPEKCNRLVSVYAANDKQSEVHAAACWARSKLLQKADARIGIVTPLLRQNREQIIRVITPVLSPGKVVQHSTVNGQSWSVALGIPLADYPMIDIAIELLALGGRKIAIQHLGKLLHTRFIKGATEEYSQRAIFDAKLRQLGMERLSLKTVYRVASEHGNASCSCEQFINLLKGFEVNFLSHASSKTPQQWTMCFSKWLALFGWPGDVALNSTEQQTLAAWQECLGELGKLDPLDKAIDYRTALSQLQRLALESRFQPETVETQIQIAGLDGSAGMQFEYLWVLNMQDDYWPEQKTQNGFIPKRCLQDFAVPTATAESRLAYARLVTEQLRQSAGEVVFSYAMREGDHECRPSPLIHDFLSSHLSVEALDVVTPAELIFKSGSTESYMDIDAPPIPAGRSVQGGSALFRDQSVCPFRAFARHRLHAISIPLTDIGLSVMERGNLIHSALQYLWQRLGDQGQLLRLSDDKRRKLIWSVVSKAIKHYALRQPEVFAERFAKLEQRRLEQLLEQWLLIELERSPFKVIATEEWQTVSFQGLELRLCVDRVDELADGRCVIIDYKTGQVSKSGWDSDNPSEPQLPLYAVTANREIAAVTFASIKTGRLAFLGEADADGILPGIKKDECQDWAGRIDEWRRVLERLAHEFLAGKAAVKPLVATCHYCDLQPLCRIHERTGSPEAEPIP